MKNGLFIFLFIATFLYSGFLYSQEKAKPAQSAPKPSPNDNKEKAGDKISSSKDKDKKEEVKASNPEKQVEEDLEPSRYETGTVQIDSKLVASNYRTLSLKLLKTLKSSFLNLGEEEKYKQLVDSYTKASIDYQKRDFVMARRKYEKNYKDINSVCEPLTQKYQEVYLKLFSENIQSVIDLKVNSGMAPEYIAVLEKYLNTAGQFHASAEHSSLSKDFSEAISFYKKSIFNLVKLSYLLQKDKIKDLSIKEKFTQGFLIEDDYIPKEYISFYDDSIDLIHKEREKEREEERLQAKKVLMEKYNFKEEKEPHKEKATEKDKAVPEEKDTLNKEPEKTSNKDTSKIKKE